MNRTFRDTPLAPGTVTEGEGYTRTDRDPVKLGKTTYAVHTLHIHETGSTITNLVGPRGAIYFLRPYNERNGDTGLRQVISFSSGNPLRVQGNEVRVHLLGDIIEVAK